MFSYEDLEVWKKTIIRAIVLIGFSFFSSCSVFQVVTLQILLNSLIFGGLYFFAELVRYYGIKPTINKEEQKKFIPLIFP
jgi:hypothetical protein